MSQQDVHVGRVVAIHLAADAGADVVSRPSVRALAGHGLEGDRYCLERGSYSVDAGPERHVTLIEAEAIEAVARERGITLEPGATRRNITTRGVSLNPLVGREFSVGDVRLRGVELCEPCGALQRRLGIDWLVKAFAHRAGLNAEVLGDGEIRVGDAVRWDAGD